MKKNLLKISILSVTMIGLLAVGNVALADSVTGRLTTGIGGNTGSNNDVNGIVIAPPVASPGADVYTSAQNVTLTANGASSIHYTIDGTTPTCSTGNVYAGAISVASSEPIEAISCYPNNISSTVASYLYGINPPNQSVSNGGGSSGSSGGGSVGGSFSSSPSTTGGSGGTVGISDFVLLMTHWGQTGTGNPADFNGDGGNIGILDFVWLMANWAK